MIDNIELTWLLDTLAAFSLCLTVLLALGLDHWLGEARRFHYLVGFGNLANQLEKKLNINSQHLKDDQRSIKAVFIGGLSWCLLVLPLPAVYLLWLNELPWYLQILLDGFILYLAIGLNSLAQHAQQVYVPLQQDDLATARHYTSYLVSRDTSQLTPEQMSRATVESMLENGHDAVIASLVYYLVGGIPLVITHRLANTLDAMWGYKTTRFLSFGYAAARLDDVLGFISGKCTTLLYALQRPFGLSLKNAYQQGNQYKSHNGGWVMAAGATVISRTLGGSAQYHGATITSPTLGQGQAVTVQDIPRSVNVVRRASGTLLLVLFAAQCVLFIL
ncbi:CobD/CbiB family cobalamin biosynthesis protein [Psychrobium sp. 1_MG-2023]|uniref:cobalamin biosynthesis protein CobD/CbiB n=1 Tax=Psychrobium sp. 1_MG-2023 TaxID=3062624 RepID=UPI0027347911|nr:CobD/CbiB family cobalamin biosynthesis protein [Psychrobium sp. 1_MG-2023]MDP2560435.1 CobD/CbiB family cobalamin biosynthesis protein [Psychrobium sp. 1_MG-2023]